MSIQHSRRRETSSIAADRAVCGLLNPPLAHRRSRVIGWMSGQETAGVPGVSLALVIGIRSLVASDDHPAETSPTSAAAGDDALAPRQTEPGDLGPDWTSRLFILIWPH
jgi:hypothetical protein